MMTNDPLLPSLIVNTPASVSHQWPDRWRLTNRGGNISLFTPYSPESPEGPLDNRQKPPLEIVIVLLFVHQSKLEKVFFNLDHSIWLWIPNEWCAVISNNFYRILMTLNNESGLHTIVKLIRIQIYKLDLFDGFFMIFLRLLTENPDLF